MRSATNEDLFVGWSLLSSLLQILGYVSVTFKHISICMLNNRNYLRGTVFYMKVYAVLYLYEGLCGTVLIWRPMWYSTNMEAYVVQYLYESLCGTVLIWRLYGTVLMWRTMWYGTYVVQYLYEGLCGTVLILRPMWYSTYMKAIWYSTYVKAYLCGAYMKAYR